MTPRAPELRNTEARLCPRGDTLHTRTAAHGAEVLLHNGLSPGLSRVGAVLGPGPDLSRCGAREELQLRSRPARPHDEGSDPCRSSSVLTRRASHGSPTGRRTLPPSRWLWGSPTRPRSRS